MATAPSITAWAGRIPDLFKQWHVVAEPDRDAPEWWAGAPSVVRDSKGTFWMAVRMRTAGGQLGQRGYEIRIFRSDDGVHFVKVHSIKREQIPTTGFERPALVIDPHSGKFKLYAWGPLTADWCIFKFTDVDSPDQFDPATVKPVLRRCHRARRVYLIPPLIKTFYFVRSRRVSLLRHRRTAFRTHLPLRQRRRRELGTGETPIRIPIATRRVALLLRTPGMRVASRRRLPLGPRRLQRTMGGAYI